MLFRFWVFPDCTFLDISKRLLGNLPKPGTSGQVVPKSDIPELPNAEPNWNDTPGAANEDTTGNLKTGTWEVTIDQDSYMENYKDIPELPNAEPNWNDTPGAANEDTTGNLETGAWEVTIDQDFYMENYKDIPELPSAEPNWVD